jgi:hypothetical protein
LKYLLTGLRPDFDPTRLANSTVLLLSDLLRQGNADVRYERDVQVSGERSHRSPDPGDPQGRDAFCDRPLRPPNDGLSGRRAITGACRRSRYTRIDCCQRTPRSRQSSRGNRPKYFRPLAFRRMHQFQPETPNVRVREGNVSLYRWGVLDDTHDEDFLSRGQVKSYSGISAIKPGFGNVRVNRRRTLETGSWT